jgi:hypothetical protein
MQCACTVLYSHLWSVRLYRIFSQHLINGTIFEKKKVVKQNVCFGFFLQRLSETFLILRKIQRDIIIDVQVHRASCKVSVIFVRFQWNISFPHRLFQKSSNVNFMKIRPVGAELWSCGWTDKHEEARSPFFAILLTRLKRTDSFNKDLHISVQLQTPLCSGVFLPSAQWRTDRGVWGFNPSSEIPKFWQSRAEFPVLWKIRP